MTPTEALNVLAQSAQLSMPISRLQEFNGCYTAIAQALAEREKLLAEKEAPAAPVAPAVAP